MNNLKTELCKGIFYNPLELLEDVDGEFLFSIFDVLDNNNMIDRIKKVPLQTITIEQYLIMDSDTFERMCMYPNNKWDMFKGNKNFTQVLFRDCMDSEPIIVKTNSQGNILGISIKH